MHYPVLDLVKDLSRFSENELNLMLSKIPPQGNQYSPFCLLPFIFWTLRCIFGTAVVELYVRGEMRRRKDVKDTDLSRRGNAKEPRMYNSTTAVPKMQRSVQKI